MIDANDQTVSRIDPNDPGDPQTFSTGSTPSDLAVGAGAVWVTNLGSKVLPESVSRLDPDIQGRRRDDRPSSQVGTWTLLGWWRRGVQPTAHRRDARRGLGDQSRLDRLPHRPAHESPGRQSRRRPGGEHRRRRRRRVGRRRRRADRRDRSENQRRQHGRSRSPAESLATLAVGGGAVWVTDPQGGSVWRIDPDPDPDEVVLRQIPLDQWVAGIAFGERAVWATNEIADKVYRIDPRTNRARVVGGLTAPRGVAVGEGSRVGDHRRPALRGRGAPDLRRAASVFYGGEGEPQFLLVSDLPLRGDAAPTTRCDGGGNPVRPRAARLRGRALHRRLSVLRLLDRAGWGGRRVPMPAEREGLRPQPGGHRGDRRLELVLRLPPDPVREPGASGAARHDQPGEHDLGLTRSGPRASSKLCTRRASGTSSASRRPIIYSPWLRSSSRGS